METHLWHRAPLVIPNIIGLVVLTEVMLQGPTRCIERLQIIVLQQEGNTGLTVTEGVADIHFVCIRNFAG